MEDEQDPEQENANIVLNQEYTELLHILCTQPSTAIMELCQMIPIHSAGQISSIDLTGSPAMVVKALLDYYSQADSTLCRNFLQHICLLCENIPMWLESRLMSVSGNPTNACDISILSETESLEEQHSKRPRIDYWEQYITSVKCLLRRRWNTIRKRLVMDVELDNVWVSVRRATRVQDRPDQTPVDRGSRTPDSDVECGSFKAKVTLGTLLRGSIGKVTALYGLPGSGKTILMSCLGELWACNLGPIPASHLFVLLEFRQLNLLSQTLSFYELLFQHYLPPEGREDDKEAIVEYLLSNPEQSCWILDGYDEFKSKLFEKDSSNALFDPRTPRPVAELISGLLNRCILPGCSVVVTCRMRDATNLDSVVDKVVQLQGWKDHEIKEYVDKYFKGKDHLAGTDFGKEATDLLFSSRHLVAMSSLPALCNISCIYLDYFLQEIQRSNEEGADVEKCNEDLFPQMPSTLTQVYLTSVGAFLSHYTDSGALSSATRLSQSTRIPLTSLVSHYTSELNELCELAWNGFQTGEILFLEEDIPKSILDFSVKTGFLSRTSLRQENGILVTAYSFIHLTLQEFLSALKIMTSSDDQEVKRRLSLKTRWPSKSGQRTFFTDSLHIYLSGLASPHCTVFLALLTKADHIWIQKRQERVIKWLKKLCNVYMTGPKILELCHCVQESQDIQLAKDLMSAKPKLELHNMTLLPNDLDALVFVIKSSEEKNIGLDFRACSIELESLELLSSCQRINSLSFHSRKYDDSFAEKLSTILPKFSLLEKFNFFDARLTATGAAHLASALLNCPCITDIDLSGNSLKDEGTKHISDILTKLPHLSSIKLCQNHTSLNAAVYLMNEISSLNIQRIFIDGTEELSVIFDPNPDRNSHKVVSEVSLLKQKWNKSEMQKLAKSLTRFPPISVLNLSGGQWKVQPLKVLVQFLPQINITEKIVVNGSCSSVEALVVLTTLMSQCTAVRELQLRQKSPSEVSIVFCGEDDSKSLSLNSCGLQPSSLEKVLRSLRHSSDLIRLDLSTNSLGDEGIETLLNGMPLLKRISEINASNNGVTMKGVILLAHALCSHNHLIHVYTSHNGSEKVFLKFCHNQSNGGHRIFRVNNSSLLPEDVTTLCKTLLQCHPFLELDLSYCLLNDDTIKNLVNVLPKMTSLQTLNLSHCDISTTGAILLAKSVFKCKRIKSVQLSSQRESILLFDKEKQDQLSCRFSDFSLDEYSLGRLLEILQNGPQLSHLDLSCNGLGNKKLTHFVDSLLGLQVTNYINLSNNGLKQQALLDVACTLSTCPRVSAVDVCYAEDQKCIIWFRQVKGQEGNCLRVSGASLNHNHQIQLAQIVSKCPSPFKLEMKNCFSGSIESFVKMLDSSCTGCTVSIEESWIKSWEAVNLLCRCLELNRNINSIWMQQTTLHLTLKKSNDLASLGVDTGSSTTAVTRKIGLIDCDINGSHLASMEDMLQRYLFLTELDLSHNNLGEKGAEFLCSVIPSLPKLASLSVGCKDVYRCVHFVEILCKALLECKTLQYLSLSGHVISETAAQMMNTVLPSLKSLNISHCFWSNCGGFQLIKSLAHCQHLEELCLDGVHLDEESLLCLAQSLQNIKTLRVFKLSKVSATSSVWDVLVAMEGLVHLGDIEMDGWKMANNQVELLARLLPSWTYLQKLFLSQTLNADQSGDKLLEALQNCIHLKELYISGNSLGDLTAARMALVFPSLTHICVIDISENCIGQKGSVCLAKAISCLENLTRINLTSVGTSELCAVVANLANCPFIQVVSLGWNNCGDDVAQELARVLPVCQRMMKIDLECNRVTVVGVEALVKALLSCPALDIIRLWKNKVSPSEAERMCLEDRRLSFSST